MPHVRIALKVWYLLIGQQVLCLPIFAKQSVQSITQLSTLQSEPVPVESLPVLSGKWYRTWRTGTHPSHLLCRNEALELVLSVKAMITSFRLLILAIYLLSHRLRPCLCSQADKPVNCYAHIIQPAGRITVIPVIRA